MDHSGLVRSARGAESRPKSILAELKAYAEGDGPPPIGLVEARIIERFHWSMYELDQADEGRTMRALFLLNVADGYRRVTNAVQSHSTDRVSESDWIAYRTIRDLEE